MINKFNCFEGEDVDNRASTLGKMYFPNSSPSSMLLSLNYVTLDLFGYLTIVLFANNLLKMLQIWQQLQLCSQSVTSNTQFEYFMTELMTNTPSKLLLPVPGEKPVENQSRTV